MKVPTLDRELLLLLELLFLLELLLLKLLLLELMLLMLLLLELLLLLLELLLLKLLLLELMLLMLLLFELLLLVWVACDTCLFFDDGLEVGTQGRRREGIVRHLIASQVEVSQWIVVLWGCRGGVWTME